MPVLSCSSRDLWSVVAAYEIQFPDQGLNPRHWELRVLATGPQGSSKLIIFSTTVLHSWLKTPLSCQHQKSGFHSWGGLIPLPAPRCWHPNSFADVIKLRILRWEDYSGLSGRAWYNHNRPDRRETGGSEWVVGNVTGEARGWSDVATGQRLLTVPGRGEEARNWKKPEMIFPLEPLKRVVLLIPWV